LFGQVQQSYGIVGVAGATSAVAEQLSDGPVELGVAEGHPIGETGVAMPVSVQVRASASEGSIRVGDREVARAGEGLALAVIAPGGQLVAAAVVDTTRTLRVPFDMQLLPLYRLSSASRCMDIGNLGWINVTEATMATRLVARVDNYRPFDSTLVFYLAADRPTGLVAAAPQGTARRSSIS